MAVKTYNAGVKEYRHLAPAGADRAGEIVCLGLRLHRELLRQLPAAPLILCQRGIVPALRRVETHESTVHVLLQRIEGEQPEPCASASSRRPPRSARSIRRA